MSVGTIALDDISKICQQVMSQQTDSILQILERKGDFTSEYVETTIQPRQLTFTYTLTAYQIIFFEIYKT